MAGFGRGDGLWVLMRAATSIRYEPFFVKRWDGGRREVLCSLRGEIVMFMIMIMI